VIGIVEASTTLREVSRDRARTAIGAGGDPLILWVGRLTSNKDPITILEGLEIALPQIPSAQVMMLFGDDTLLEGVEQTVRESEVLRARVLLAGRIAHDEMPNYYGAADVFVSGSHSEGSGYALIEAMSAGVVPVVTDIPSFRAIAGDCGARFPTGDADAFAAALVRTCASDLSAAKAATRSRFERALSWQAIATRTVAEYQSIVDTRRSQ
jgi:glycosyltransferase involved in cell wall biosynthesis